MTFSSIKEASRLISKGMSSIYLLKVTFEINWPSQNFRFSKFKQFFFSSVFGEGQLTQILFNFKTCCSSKIRGLWAKLCGVCVTLILKEIMTFYKNKNFNKGKTESLRETNLVFQLIWKSQIESKTVTSCSSWKERAGIFCTVYFVRRRFFDHLSFISMYSVLNKL